MRRVFTVIAVAATGLLPLPATAQPTHTCFGEPATVVGTPEGDNLRGDVVVGLAGVDFLVGRLVCGGKDGDDQLRGQMVNGGPGDENEIWLSGPLALGGPGNDEFIDSSGGSSIRQVWRGGSGNDGFNPDSGEDVYYGGAGNDGSGGEQDLSGETRQFGGVGSDTLSGGAGKDKLFGGADNDTLNTGRVGVDTNPGDFIDGGDGFDTCTLGAGDRAVNCEDVTVVS